MRGVFDDLVFLMGTGVLGDHALFVINGYELLIGLEGEDHGGMGKGDAVAVLFLAGCGAAARESGFYEHNTMYRNWDHFVFSLFGYKG